MSESVDPGCSIAALQRLAGQGWPGLEQVRLGAWVLRAGGGFTGRANAALPLGDPGMPTAEAIEAVRAFYQKRGLVPKVQVPFGVDGPDDPADGLEGLDAALRAAGWSCDEPTLFMVGDLTAGGAPDPALPTGYEVTLAASPDDQWLSLYHYRGGTVPEVGRAVIMAAPATYLSLRNPEGDVVGIARLAPTQDWVGLTAVEVSSSIRRRGLGRALTANLLRHGRDQGARYAYLQVFEHNQAARRLYESMGFWAHHRYHYRTLDDAVALG